MQLTKRAVVYSSVVVALALVLSAALLQVTQIGAQAKPLAQNGALPDFSLTVVKDAIPDSTQPFTFEVYFQGAFDATAQALHTFELVDDGAGVSNTATITEPAGQVTQTFASIYEYPASGWLPTNVACQDETGAPVTPRVPVNLRAAEVAPGVPVYVSFPIVAGTQYTCTFTNGAPAITLDKTVGTNPAVCATTDEITVLAGTQATYCYNVTNTGGLSLTLHSLADDQLGDILNNLPYTLTPGASVFVTQTATPSATVTNVATWTAAMTHAYAMPGLAVSLAVDDEVPIGNVYTLTAVATDTATVNVEPLIPSIAVTKTVGAESGVCAATSEITVLEGTTVYYCYTVQNTGNVPLPLHDLVDSELGAIFTGLNYNLAPGASVDTVAAGVPVPAVITVDTTNVATWTAYLAASPTAESVTASASATVNVEPLAPSIAVTKTVGTQADVCAVGSSIEVEAGTTVYYCYTVRNTGNVALPLHDLVDSDLGTILSGLNYLLAPGSSVNTVAAGVTVSKTVDVATTNVATWTAYVDGGVTAQSATAVDSATVTMAPLNIDVEPQPGSRRLFLPQIGK